MKNKKYYGLIYKAINKINGKIYIGQTVRTLKERKNQHIKLASKNTKDSHFYLAINKYGEDKFIWTIIEKVNSKNELNNREQYWIKYYNSNDRKYGYNLNSGGRQNCKYNKEVREKISNKLKGRKLSNEAKRNISIGLKGRKITWKDKISKSNLGKHFVSDDIKNKMSKGQIERYKNKPKEKASNKTKKLMSKSQKERFKKHGGIKHNKEWKINQSIKMKKAWETRDRNKSDIEKQKISKGVKKYYKKNPMKQETKDKIRAYQLTRIIKPETREKLRQINLGKKMPDDVKRKISITKKKQWAEKKLLKDVA